MLNYYHGLNVVVTYFKYTFEYWWKWHVPIIFSKTNGPQSESSQGQVMMIYTLAWTQQV